eukprot:4465829-Amphidinium_carterae.1
MKSSVPWIPSGGVNSNEQIFLEPKGPECTVLKTLDQGFMFTGRANICPMMASYCEVDPLEDCHKPCAAEAGPIELVNVLLERTRGCIL